MLAMLVAFRSAKDDQLAANDNDRKADDDARRTV